MGAKRETILPAENLRTIIREQTNMRVTKDTGDYSVQILEKLSQELVIKSIAIAHAAKRETLKSRDLEIAYDQVIGNIVNNKLPFASVKRLMQSQGSIRISDNSVKLMRSILENYLIQASRKAKFITQNSKRKNITLNDLKIALL